VSTRWGWVGLGSGWVGGKATTAKRGGMCVGRGVSVPTTMFAQGLIVSAFLDVLAPWTVDSFL
jgi:hypothetical protein